LAVLEDPGASVIRASANDNAPSLRRAAPAGDRPEAANISRVTVYPADWSSTHSDQEHQQHHAPELERQLLRSSVLEMAARRTVCTGCGRALLVGERYHVFDSGVQEQRLCDLCLTGGSAASHGDPPRVERVWAAERRLTIRRAA
jgi:hypothetical protein